MSITIFHEIEEAPVMVVADTMGNTYAIPSKMIDTFEILDKQIHELYGTDHSDALVEVWDNLFEQYGIDMT